MRKILVLLVLVGIVFSGCGIDNNISDMIKSPNYQTDENIEGIGKETEKVYRDFLNLIESGKNPAMGIKG